MEEKITFECSNITCSYLELHWNYKSDQNSIESYKIYQKEGGNHYLTNYLYFKPVYEGKDTNLEIKNLKPDTNYTFKLEINLKDSYETKIIGAKTLKAPYAIVSEKSLEITNGEITEDRDKIQEYQKNIIKNCSKLIFEENDNNVLKGIFDGIIIKLTHEIETNTYYMSFDIESNYFQDFFNQYLKECDSNIMIPCHFIIPKLPTIFIFDLLEKSSVIFTGKRMGGVIASSLLFYIMYIGKTMNINYGNAFIISEKKNVGVVTFGSSSFLSKLDVAVKMRQLSSYFYHIKEEFDFIPEIIDYISHEDYFDNNNKYLKDINFKDLINIFNNLEFDIREINLLDKYLTSINFTENNLKLYIEKYIRIPFGYYFMMKNSDGSLISINDHTFMQFYYLKKFHSTKNTSHLKVYKSLASNIIFNKESLEYLLNKDNKIEIIKIIRRNNDESENESKNKSKELKVSKQNIKVIIKFELQTKSSHSHDNITPDIIDKIKLCSSDKSEIIIKNKDIFYDNDNDITAYIDILSENLNINEVTIINHFSGEIKPKYILNIQGSGPTRKMLYDNLEKLFLIPFFKLFEIFYITQNQDSKYEELKQENFGSNFEDLKILKPFEKQIKALNELLLFTRPDLLANKEKQFIQMYINDDIKNLKLSNEEEDIIKTKIKENLIKYYEQAKILQKEQNINCINSEKESNANNCSFPQNSEGNEIKKLFMCKFDYSLGNNKDDFISRKFDDTYIKNFYIKNFIAEVLNSIEKELREKLVNCENIKCYLNENIGNFYNEYIIPHVYFIRMLILVSIESGDLIKFYHNINWTRFWGCLNSPKMLINLIPSARYEFFEHDFVKIFPKEIIENIHMKNLFYKKKMKNLINSNIDSNNNDNSSTSNNGKNVGEYINKIKRFSNYSETGDKIGKEYYEAFLQLLNNSSDDFQEDIETSIYDNLKMETEKKECETKENNNNSNINIITTIIDMMNDYIIDEESKKGFLALLKQSFLLGELRTNIVSLFFYNFLKIIGKRIYYRYIREKKGRKIYINSKII